MRVKTYDFPCLCSQQTVANPICPGKEVTKAERSTIRPRRLSSPIEDISNNSPCSARGLRRL